MKEFILDGSYINEDKEKELQNNELQNEQPDLIQHTEQSDVLENLANDNIGKTEFINEPEQDNLVIKEEVVEETAEEMVEEIETSDDIKELRTEYVKQYKNNNNTYSAVIYSEPVHCLDDKKQFSEINNELVFKKGAKSFENKRNSFKVSFKEDLKTNDIFTIEKGIYKATLALNEGAGINDGKNFNKKAAKKIDKTEKSEAKKHSFCQKKSKLIYENFKNNTDIEYSLLSGRIKENIIIKEKSDNYEFDFDLKLDNLDIKLSADNRSLELCAADTGELIFTIPSPFMFDAENNFSQKVKFNVAEKSENIFGFKIIPDAEWINAKDRKFPVTVDPQIVSSNASIITVKSYSGSTEELPSDPIKYAGFNSNKQKDIKVKLNLTEILTKAFEKNSRILNATLELTKVSQSIGAGANNGFEVKCNNKTVDFLRPTNNNIKVCIDVTEQFNNFKTAGGNLEIIISAKALGSDYMAIASELIAQDASKPVIYVDYVSEKINAANSPYQTSEVNRAGTGSINLFSGNLSFTHPDISTDSSIMPVGVSHVYNGFNAGKEYSSEQYLNREEKLTQNYHTGKGWKLNLHQNLIRKEKTNDGVFSYTSQVYTYIDGAGNYHDFEEKYYYKNGEEKIYIDKEKVEIGYDGKLTYTENNMAYEIELELKTSSGLNLISEVTGFKNAKDLETRSEDLARICLEVEQLENYKLDLENGIKISDLTEKLIQASKIIQEKQSEMELKSYDVEDKTLNLMTNIQFHQDEIRRFKDELAVLTRDYVATKYKRAVEELSYDRDYYDKRRAYEKNKDNGVTDMQEAESYYMNYLKHSAHVSDYNGYRFITGTSSFTIDRDYNYASTNKQYGNNEPYNSIWSQEKQIETLSNNTERGTTDIIGTLQLRREINNLRKGVLDLIIKYENKNYSYRAFEELLQNFRNSTELEKIKRELKLTEKSLKQKIFERDRMLSITPVSYITGDKETYLGFNTEGRLVAIFDKYENQILIEYEKDKIVKVYDGENKITAFDYKDGLLSSIRDARGRVTSFTYDNSFLSTVTYPDGDNLETKFEYDSEFKLTKVISPLGLGVRYSYANGKVIKAEEITETEKISADGKILTQNIITKDDIKIVYSNYNNTQITDSRGNCKVYIFNQKGGVVTEYEKNDYTSYIDAVKPVSHDYQNGRRAFTITPYPYAEDLLNGAMEGGFSLEEPECYCGEDILCSSENPSYCGMYETAGKALTMTENPCGENILFQGIDLNNLPAGEINFILSGWAKADSAFINPHRENAYSKNEIDYKHIESFDEYKKKRRFELKAEVWYTSDGNNTDEFHCSFDWLNTGWQYCAVPVTLRKDEAPVDFKIYADYSFNVNTVMFAKIELKQGAYEESKFDAEGKKLSTKNSSGAEVVYGYDCKGKNLIKSTLKKDGKEYLIKYDYDPNNNLIRTVDFRGLVNENIYDNKGRITKSVVYNLSDPTSKLYSEKEYAENGQTLADIDPRGENENGETLKTSYEYINGTNIVSGVKSSKGHKTTFGHNPHNDSLMSISAISEDKDNINLFDYTAGIMTGSSSNGLNYGFEYDGFLRAKKILVAGNDYLENFYNENSSKFTLNNGESFETEYDKRGNIIKIYYANSKSDKQLLVENSYDEKGSLTETIDYSNKLFYNDTNGNTTVFNRSGAKGLLESAESKQHGKSLNIANTYDAENNPKTVSYILNGESAKAYSYEYDSMTDNRLNSIMLPNGLKQINKYDGLGRITERKSGANFSSNIYYLKNGDHATNFVSSVWYGLNGVIKDNLKYSYDEHGNVEKAFENGELKCRYSYDELDRLVREDNKYLNKTVIYFYDSNGNITSKTAYAFTLKDNLDDLTGTSIEYGYKTSGWKDQLINYNGNNGFVYDSLGNPTTYRGKTLIWERGRKLFGYDGKTFTYNADGIRTSRTSNGVKTKYYLDGGCIIKEERSGVDIWYHYGTDSITGFNCNGTECVYRKNLSGDITHIYSIDGTLMAKYIYDAWGNHKVLNANGTEDTDPVFIGNINPFRYKGYYYDTSIGLYYLNSRYYDSETGRFINADNIGYLDPETLNGLNLYAYCGSNPVMRVDPEGHGWLDWLLLVLGAICLFIPYLQPLGVGLLVGVGLMQVSNLVSYYAPDSKIASIISGGLNILAGIALCFTPFAAIGATFIGAGIGGIAGGFISEALGGSFELGYVIGSVIGGVIGGLAYKAYDAYQIRQIAKQGTVVIGEGMNTRVIPKAQEIGAGHFKASWRANSLYKISKPLGSALTKSENYTWINRVIQSGVNVVDIGIEFGRDIRSTFYLMEMRMLYNILY